MRNKRLIILISVLVGVVALIVIMSAVFTVYNIEARCVENYTAAKEEEIAAVNAEVETAASSFKYRSIFLFDEDELASAVNSAVARAEVLNVECLFPNKVRVEYRYVDDDVCVFSGGKYLVAGSYGKITRVSDRAEEVGDIISVTPSSAPSGSAVGQYLYADGAFDGMAIDVFLNYAESLVNSDGKHFRSMYKSIDLSEALSYMPKITVVMEDGLTFEVNGSLNMAGENSTFADRGTLEKAVSALAGFYAEHGPETQGTVTVQYIGGEFVVSSNPSA